MLFLGLVLAVQRNLLYTRPTTFANNPWVLIRASTSLKSH